MMAAFGLVPGIPFLTVIAVSNIPDTLDALRFYRQELERQRDARRGTWRWWLPALAPCLMAIFLSLFLEVRPIPWIPIGLLAAWVVVGVGLGIAAYERSARGYQQEIDALDSLS